MSEQKVELAPCPFCGGEALTHRVPGLGRMWCVSCKNCDASPSGSFDERDAARNWNTREHNLSSPDAMREALSHEQDFSRITLRHNLKQVLSENRDVHPETMLDRILDAIPRVALASSPAASAEPVTTWASPGLKRAYREIERLKDQLNQHPESGIDEALRTAMEAIETADMEVERVAC